MAVAPEPSASSLTEFSRQRYERLIDACRRRDGIGGPRRLIVLTIPG